MVAIANLLVRVGARARYLGFAASLFLCAALMGQEGLSTLRGTATDSSGAVVAGVSVTARETLTNIVARTVTTDGQGNYEMPALKAGRYQVVASMPGFKRAVVDDVMLQSNQVRRVELVLEVGEVATEVTVSAAAVAISTEQGKIGTDFNAAQRYWDLPAPGNAFSGTYAILAILPHIQRRPGDWGAPTFAGQSGNQVHMAQDGVKEENLNSQTVSMEAATELKAVAVNNTADYARVGYFDTITKSGTNDYHVEASYYHRNSALGARNFFEDKKAPVIYHTFNLSGAGPIIKNKTFFYGLWNGERVPGSTFYLRTVPTAAMRTGDFSQLLRLARPVVIQDPLTGQPFSGNLVPPQRLSSVARLVQEEFFPQPNRGGPDALVNNFGFIFPYPDDQFYADVVSVRVDHRLSERNSLFGRVQIYLPRYVLARALPTLTGTRLRQSHSWVFTDTHVFSPNVINTFSFGGNRDGIKDGQNVDGVQPVSAAAIVKKVGLQGVNQQGLDRPGGSPVFRISGFPTIDARLGGFLLSSRNFNFADSVTWAAGRHVVKFGGELRMYSSFDGQIPNANFGDFTFNARWSGNAYADFMLGLPFSSTRLNPIVNRKRTSKELGLFLTDTFKITPKLTLDYGLRWDYFSSATFSDGLMFAWDRNNGNVIVAENARSKLSPFYPRTINVVTGQVAPDPGKGNFVPRIGLAYRWNDQTVIRGGYGIFNEFLGRFVRVEGGGPFQVTETYFNTIESGVPLFQMPNSFPAGGVSPTVPSQSVSGYPLQTENGLIHQFSLTVERQVADVGFRLSYVGSRNRGMNYGLQINKPAPSLIPFTAARRPYTQFVGASFPRSDGRANYDSLNLQVNRRVGWVTFDAHWTWAHGMADFLNTENPYNPTIWNRDFFAKHRVVFNTLWELPLGRGKRFLHTLPGVADHIVGGWRVAWVSYLQGGQYFSPSFSGADPSNTNTFGGLPDRICDGNLAPGERRVDRWFNSSCFVRPPAGRFGNSGANVLEGPGLHSHNVTVAKRFRLTEKLHFDYMCLISNIFNRTNFLFPATNISDPGQAGVIGETHGLYSGERGGQRMIEMRVRLQF